MRGEIAFRAGAAREVCPPPNCALLYIQTRHGSKIMPFSRHFCHLEDSWHREGRSRGQTRHGRRVRARAGIRPAAERRVRLRFCRGLDRAGRHRRAHALVAVRRGQHEHALPAHPPARRRGRGGDDLRAGTSDARGKRRCRHRARGALQVSDRRRRGAVELPHAAVVRRVGRGRARVPVRVPHPPACFPTHSSSASARSRKNAPD